MTKEDLNSLLELTISEDPDCNKLAESIVINNVDIKDIKPEKDKLNIEYLCLLLCLLEKHAYNHKLESKPNKTEYTRFLENTIGISLRIDYGYTKVDFNHMKIVCPLKLTIFGKDNCIKFVNRIYYSMQV